MIVQIVCADANNNVHIYSGFDISFSLWMDIRAEIREIIANGSKNFNFM